MIGDWHPEDVKAAIRKTGISLSDLARVHSYSVGAVQQALWRPWPTMQAIIAAHLGLSPQEIWPSRYHADGTPIRQRTRHSERLSRAAEPLHDQKEAAA